MQRNGHWCQEALLAPGSVCSLSLSQSRAWDETWVGELVQDRKEQKVLAHHIPAMVMASHPGSQKPEGVLAISELEGKSENQTQSHAQIQ